MKILHRFMLKQFIGPFILTFIVVVFTLLMQFLWKYIDDLVGKGLELSVIGELLLYTSANLSIMAFPLSVLLASILTLGNLGENYELIAFKAAGISLQRIVFPIFILSIFIGIGAFLFANNITPVTNLKTRALLHSIQQQRPELQIREGVFYNGIDGYTIRIGSRNYETKQLYDLWIYNHSKHLGNIETYMADSGYMRITSDKRFMEITLYHGYSYVERVTQETINKRNKTYPFRHDSFDKQVFRMALPGSDLERSDEQLFKQSYQMMNLNQLNYTIDSLHTLNVTKESELQNIVEPFYQAPKISYIDTTQRVKILDNYKIGFDQHSKAVRLRMIQDAIVSARAQKEQFVGINYEIGDRDKRIWRYEVEWHRKFTMSLACIIFFFVGAPLGAIVRKGGLGTPIIIAVLFFVLYYVISMIGEKSAKSGSMTPFYGMWLSTFIVLPVSIFLTFLATRDSSIFNQELYLSYIKKGLNFVFVSSRSPRQEIAVHATPEELTPASLVCDLESLSQASKAYLTDKLGKILRFRKIWYTEEDSDLLDIGRQYDHIKVLLNMSNIAMIKETLAEYPKIALHDYRIKKTAGWQPIAAAIIFPVWIYLYLKAMVQKYTLRNELKNIMSSNHNLINELNSVM